MANAVINAGTFIKDGVIINTSASIDHDCLIDDFAHISPNCSFLVA
jgi:UDP-3-O-[3-hydroxymyristoyl] glucosamine N-acyltransferase